MVIYKTCKKCTGESRLHIIRLVNVVVYLWECLRCGDVEIDDVGILSLPHSKEEAYLFT
ncbi:MAG: hypothetical protein ACFFCE_01690 [Promethearchaeota archaeon]